MTLEAFGGLSVGVALGLVGVAPLGAAMVFGLAVILLWGR